jgi:DNA-binding XRE family transcriptional regulator
MLLFAGDELLDPSIDFAVALEGQRPDALGLSLFLRGQVAAELAGFGLGGHRLGSPCVSTKIRIHILIRKINRQPHKMYSGIVESDDALKKSGMTPETCRAARALLGLSQTELGRRAGVTLLTVANYESGKTKDPALSTWRSIRSALEKAGVRFIDESDDHGPGVLMKKVRGAK